MKDKFFISITDHKGTRSYSFDKVIKKYLFALGFAFIGVIAALIVLVFILKGKLEEYTFYRLENDKLLNQIDRSRDNIEAQQFELENLNVKLSDIEKMIGEDNVNDLNEDERLDIVAQTLAERKYLLQIIPSGNPIIPFKGYTSNFGERIHPVYSRLRFHYGIDFSADIGTSIIAPADGIVSFAGANDGGYGNLVIMMHAFGFETYFGHLSEVKVNVGDVVTKGTVIAKSGNTGVSTGPHLHYEVHYLGKRINPISFAKWNIENYKYLFENEKGVKWQSLVRMTELQMKIIHQKE